MDGFGLFVVYGDQRWEIVNAYLDECHEHNHIIGRNESESETYHYNLTNAYAYIATARGSYNPCPTGKGADFRHQGAEHPGSYLELDA